MQLESRNKMNVKRNNIKQYCIYLSISEEFKIYTAYSCVFLVSASKTLSGNDDAKRRNTSLTEFTLKLLTKSC